MKSLISSEARNKVLAKGKALIIVESPTKAKTLGNFLGKGYEVISTMGHIRDLPEKKLGIKIKKSKDNKYSFEPEYVLLEKKKETIDKLKKAAQKAGKIFLATDPDREGEAIAWHTATLLGMFGKPAENFDSVSDSLAK